MDTQTRGGKLTSPTNIKKYVMARAKVLRPAWKVTQVSAQVYEEAETHLRLWLDNRLKAHPTRGQTFS